ncbi:MAG TPA: ATP-binding protein [Thermoanaerobaculia bacterium]|jgi:two-component system sensor histidine kinase QseC|nr:ATP-binding protein [Thermoanaerobaculia bacterium]
MSSLRGRLTAGLLIGTGVLLAAGGWVLDHVLSTRLRRDYDAALLTRARSLATLTEQGSGRVWLQYTDEVMPDFGLRRHPDYFELWLADGSIVERSRSLGTRDLPHSGAPLDHPRLRDLTLPDGRRGRSAEITFHPLSEQEEDRLRDSEQSAGHGASPEDLRVTLVVAHGRDELDSFLGTIHLALTLVALGLLLGTAALVKLVVGAGLAPLDDLGRRLDSLGAESLGETLELADAPAELVPTIRHLNGLLARLQESFARERAFSANLAHELRTPLAELRAVTEVALKCPEDSASWPASFAEIRTIGLQMETLVVNLLALARCDARQSTVHASEVPLRELAANAWSAFSSAARKKGMAFQLDVPEGLLLATDREKLALILSNLFANAVAYGSPGSAVRCLGKTTEAGFALSIRNSTADLVPDDLPRIFDRFWRKDTARSDGQHAGLGLALVAALCETLDLGKEAHLRGGCFEITLNGPAVHSSSLH